MVADQKKNRRAEIVIHKSIKGHRWIEKEVARTPSYPICFDKTHGKENVKSTNVGSKMFADGIWSRE